MRAESTIIKDREIRGINQSLKDEQSERAELHNGYE